MLGGYYLGQPYPGMSGMPSFELVLEDTVHSHTVDNVALTQKHTITIADTLHGHTVDGNLVLVEHKTLVVQDATHGHTVDAVVLTQKHTLAVAYTLHGHTVGSLALTQKHTLVVADTLHGHLSDNLDINQYMLLQGVADTNHAFSSDEIVLIQKHVLNVADSYHTHLSTKLDIINWADFNRFKGDYFKRFNQAGDLTKLEQENFGTIVLKPISHGTFGEVTTDSGIYIKKPLNND